MQVEKEQYEYYLEYVEKFKKRCPPGEEQEEYESFLNYEFCRIVKSFFQKRKQDKTTANIEHYVNAGLKKAIIYKYYAKNNRKNKSAKVSYIDAAHIIDQIDKLEGKMEHPYYKKLQIESEIMNDPKITELFISEKVGWIDLKNDLFVNLNLRHICFVLLSLQGVTYRRIANDFQCSVKTVERVIKIAKEIILINAHKLGYRI
ncbi:MAG: helix-turn-helix domain-containing protein [Tissierellales bacterium]|nr:helix-turn-helix domain-containing protein [Tissierellales bacterium]